MSRRLLITIIVTPPLLMLLPALAVYHYVAYDLPPRLSDDARAAAMAPLRAAVDGAGPAAAAPERPSHPELQRTLPGKGQAVVTVWSYGRRAARVFGQGKSAADALADAATQLAADETLGGFDADRRRLARVQVDLVTAHAPLVTRFEATTALSVIPGLDGVGVGFDDRELLLLPDELVEKKLLGAKTPIPMVKEFRVGLQFDHAEAELARRAALPPGAYGGKRRRYFRFRTDSFVERPADDRAAGAPLPLTRGLPPGPELTSENLLHAAKMGGLYLTEHLAPNGRYYYQVDLSTGTATDPGNLAGDYSLPRHAGTTYYLAELYEVTRDPELLKKIELAFDHMITLIEAGGCKGTTPEGKPYMCVVDKGRAQANMGSTALAVVAISEYRLATGSTRYDEAHKAMVEWILMLQKPDGRFAHLYNVPTRQADWKTVLLYFDGEAALALARSYKIFKDERMIRGAERALDTLVGWYDFFAGQFFFGEEHWTCIASEAAWPDLKHDRYREFCSDYAAFLRTQQFQPGETPGQEDLTGSYGVTPFFVPNNTPVGSRSEAMISSYLLTKYHGKPDARIKRQVLLAMKYLLRQQIRPDNDWFTPARAALGAITTSAVDRTVRIDYVQHACSALLRSIELLEEDGADPTPN